MGASFNSKPVNLSNEYSYAIQAIWSAGTATSGTIKLQASCDPGMSDATPPASTNWTDISGSANTISTTSGNIMWDVAACGYRWVRVVYTRTAGTATINVNMNLKGN